jgi:hypothetical protein
MNWPGSTLYYAQLQAPFVEHRTINFKKEVIGQELWVKSEKGDNMAYEGESNQSSSTSSVIDWESKEDSRKGV